MTKMWWISVALIALSITLTPRIITILLVIILCTINQILRKETYNGIPISK